MALYIPHSIFHLVRFLYVKLETFGPYYVCYSIGPAIRKCPSRWRKSHYSSIMLVAKPPASHLNISVRPKGLAFDEHWLACVKATWIQFSNTIIFIKLNIRIFKLLDFRKFFLVVLSQCWCPKDGLEGSRSALSIQNVLVSNLGSKATYFEFFYKNTRLAS